MKRMKQTDKLVVVTGASRGLGLEICRQVLAAGYQVVAVARSCSPELESLLSDTVIFEPFDLANTEDIHEFSRRIQTQYGRPWALINNAGIGQNSILATLHESELEQLLKVNLQAPILLSKYLLRGMLLNQGGRLINITSIVANTGFNGLSVYGASKAGLEGFTKSLAREVGKLGVTVNNIAPGYMQTEMTDALQGEALEKISRRQALKRLVTPAEVAASVVFLLSDQSAAITGTTLTVDGGATA